MTATGRGHREPAALVAAARGGDPRALARLVSLVENALAAAARGHEAGRAAHRAGPVIGLTGAPGVGKSTVTDALVRAYRDQGLRVGVLAVDPTSPFTGGALLGDRVRMQDHATDRGVFIRSMASRGHLGGLSWAAPQALRILDAAGFDVIMIETVGVGQAEVEIASLADTTLVIVAPGMGDSHPGGQGGDPGDRRHLRGEQERPPGRPGDRPGPAHDAGHGPLRPGRLEAADRLRDRRDRRGDRRPRGPPGGARRVARRVGRAGPQAPGPGQGGDLGDRRGRAAGAASARCPASPS